MKTGLANEALLGAAWTGRAPRGESSSRSDGAGFAGLLDGARQRFDGRSSVYDGSAFDVPEAKAAPKTATPPSRAAAAAELERRQIEQRQQRARGEAQTPEHEEPAPARAAEAKPAASTIKSRANEAPREADRPPREAEAADETAEPTDGGDAEATTAHGVTEADEAPAAACPTTQDWMNRMAAMSASAHSANVAEGEGAKPNAALQAQAVSAGAATPGQAAQGAAQTLGSAGEVAAAAVLATPTEAAADASAPAVASLRVDAPGALPPGHAAAPASTNAAPAAAAQTTATVPVPLEAPDFSKALGWQLATLARDGVHEAQLQLNPVDMGPVQVQILLDGGQAQIDFTAAQARTRDVLEAGWPALAAAMNAAGFTLGGGGVSEQRPQDRDGQGAGTGPRSRGGDDGGDAAALSGVTGLTGAAPRGLLDLYA